jgi:hypothetical protein
LSLPKEAQDLKKLDLRHMCDTVVRELEVVEREAAYDYVKVSEELETLGSELIVADGVMEELEKVLYNFKDHLEEIKSEMTSLQDKSNKINTSLSNKKKIQTMLSSFIESAVLEKELIEAICTADINEQYVGYIQQLIKKLSKAYPSQASSATTRSPPTPKPSKNSSPSSTNSRPEPPLGSESSCLSKLRFSRSPRLTSRSSRKMCWGSTRPLRSSSKTRITQ